MDITKASNNFNKIKTDFDKNLPVYWTGRLVRENKNLIALKKNQNAIKSIENKIAKINSSKKSTFKDICCTLIVSMRSRYSNKDEETKKNFFGITLDQKISIKLLNVTQMLQTLVNKDFDEEDAKALLVFCTHQHTTMSSVNSYPQTIKNIMINARIIPDNDDLNRITLLFKNNNFKNDGYIDWITANSAGLSRLANQYNSNALDNNYHSSLPENDRNYDSSTVSPTYMLENVNKRSRSNSNSSNFVKELTEKRKAINLNNDNTIKDLIKNEE